MARMSVAVLGSGLLIAGALAFVSSCGSDDKDDDTSTPAPTSTATSVSFTEVNTVLKAKCAGSTCHSSGNSNGAKYTYIDNQTVYDAAKSEAKSRIALPTSNVKYMPQGGTLTDAEKATINNY
jgi:predicted CxxxxCH...CXXCH cytochrome family protein